MQIKKSLTILVTGASGLLGVHLVAKLKEQGHKIITVSTTIESSSTVGHQVLLWTNPDYTLELRNLPNLDIVIHLAGENIASERWTKEKKQRIAHSRIQSTYSLVQAMSQLKIKPKAFLCASAVGFYGNRGDELLTERSSEGTGFLTETAIEWEYTAKSAIKLGIRTISLRFGTILSIQGGALKKMIPPFQWGLGAILGSGRQYMSWISLEDAVEAMIHIIYTSSLQGPLNLVAPNPVTNYKFSQELAKALHRPCFLYAPKWVLHCLFGEMAKDILLSSTKAIPQTLLDSGYQFRHSTLEQALDCILTN
ncbi:MAG: hypothetical protein K0S74_1487 [Chlamydiales bacterium]|jgi:uncharacterized protein (TIGR01777 family)|nr:hypothetical protein [Chlamydiales bacterium]